MDAPIFTYLLIAATVGVSWLGFNRPDILEKLIFDPHLILSRKEYNRLITSGFIHGSWEHLLFNMLSFYCFAVGIEARYGPSQLAFIYVSSIVGGGLLSLLIHRHHAYRALGASGGVCGVIFASIFLFPGGSVLFFFIPIPIPAWLYAIAFLVASFFFMRRGRGNLGHDAHIGGAVIGLLVTTALHPSIVQRSPLLYATVLLLSIAIFAYTLLNPLGLSFRSILHRHPRPKWASTNTGDRNEEERINALLDKISKHGIHSLTPAEQELLRRRSRHGPR